MSLYVTFENWFSEFKNVLTIFFHISARWAAFRPHQRLPRGSSLMQVVSWHLKRKDLEQKPWERPCTAVWMGNEWRRVLSGDTRERILLLQRQPLHFRQMMPPPQHPLNQQGHFLVQALPCQMFLSADQTSLSTLTTRLKKWKLERLAPTKTARARKKNPLTLLNQFFSILSWKFLNTFNLKKSFKIVYIGV